MRILARYLPAFSVTQEAINCHHNYIDREVHFGREVWVTRKGAIRAGVGDLGVIPGSMGTSSYIVRGRGNPESFFLAAVTALVEGFLVPRPRSNTQYRI